MTDRILSSAGLLHAERISRDAGIIPLSSSWWNVVFMFVIAFCKDSERREQRQMNTEFSNLTVPSRLLSSIKIEKDESRSSNSSTR